MTDDNPEKRPLSGLIPTLLPSGRRISLVATNRGEELSILSPEGTVEISIELTPSGPLLKLRGARLEIDSTESVALRCKSFELHAERDIQLEAGGDLRVGTTGDVRVKSGAQTFIDGDYVNLNCLDRTGYHDEAVVPGGEEASALDVGHDTPPLESGPAGSIRPGEGGDGPTS